MFYTTRVEKSHVRLQSLRARKTALTRDSTRDHRLLRPLKAVRNKSLPYETSGWGILLWKPKKANNLNEISIFE